MIDNYPQSKDMDLYSANADYAGSRQIVNIHEIVEFHNSTTVRIWFNEQNAVYDTHWHNALEIIMPHEFHYDVEIGDACFHIMPGDIFIIPPGEMHKLIAPPKGSRFIFLFDITPLTRLKGFAGIQSLLVAPYHIKKDLYPKIYDDLRQYLMIMKDEYFSKHEYAELSIYANLINFFIKLGYNRLNESDMFPNVRLYKQKEYMHKFNELMDFIDTHYMEDLSLESIADMIGFSKFHFSRLFKQYTNFTFCDYICYRRIKAAEELLAQPDLSITEVALQSGFPSISTFNRLFKQQKECTPSEYRAKNAGFRH